jgi:hypothetical protein
MPFLIVFSAMPLSGVVFVPCVYNRLNTIGNYTYATLMPLQNESKRNDNWTKRTAPSKNIEVLIILGILNRIHLF